MNDCKTVVNSSLEGARLNILPKKDLLNTLNKLNLEKIIKDCWYEFITSVYKNEKFKRLSAYINPATATLRITNLDTNEIYTNQFIEVYSIDYEEIRNIHGGSLLQSRFYVDRLLEAKKKEGLAEKCREHTKEKIESLFNAVW